MPTIKWREYLRGEYIIGDENQRVKIHHDIRLRAKRMMSDLLLIAEKSDSRQKTQIFKIPETRKRLVIPLIIALHNNSAFLTPEAPGFEDTERLMQDLELAGMEYDLVRLFDSSHPDHKIYCEHKRQQANQRLEEMGKLSVEVTRR